MAASVCIHLQITYFKLVPLQIYIFVLYVKNSNEIVMQDNDSWKKELQTQ